MYSITTFVKYIVKINTLLISVFQTSVTRRVLHVELDLLILLKYLRSASVLVWFVLLTLVFLFALVYALCVLYRGWTEVCRHIYSPHVTIMSCR